MQLTLKPAPPCQTADSFSDDDRLQAFRTAAGQGWWLARLPPNGARAKYAGMDDQPTFTVITCLKRHPWGTKCRLRLDADIER
jgi:hypothetical protein